MNVGQLSVRAKILLATGDLAEIVAINNGEESVRVRYLDALGSPELVDTEAWVSADEVISLDTGSHVEGKT